MVRIETLTPEFVRSRIDDFLDIASDVDGEYWREENFLYELPEKWRLSLVVVDADRPVGYAIVSRRSPERAHLHHFMVHREFRSGGIGANLADRMEFIAAKAGASWLSLKVAIANDGAQRFYAARDYREEERDDCYLTMIKPIDGAQ